VTYDDLGASGERHLAEFDRCAEHVEEACGDKGGGDHGAPAGGPHGDVATVIAGGAVDRAKPRQPVLKDGRREPEVTASAKCRLTMTRFEGEV
jgi:hypothetical protein